MAGPQLPFAEALQNPYSFLGVDTKPAQPTNRLETEIADLGKREEKFLTSNIDLTRQLGDMMIRDAEGKNLLKVKEKELEAEHSRERKRIRDRLGEEYYNSPDMQEFKKFADESADKMMFVPSQTTAPLLGVVFATIGATGLLLGGLSKGNAKAALSAMNGMAEGFTKGKEDLYKQERQTFDTNVKAMTQRMGILKAKLDVAREKMKYDAESADMEANAAFAEAGADFLKANKDKFGLQDSITKLETQIKQNDTWARLMETKKSAAIKELEAQKFKAHQSELERTQKEFLQSQAIESRERQAASDRALRASIAEGQRSSEAQGRELRAQIAQDQLAAKGTKTPGFSDRFGFGENVAIASNEAAKTISNIMGLPVETTSGLFGGRQTTSLFTAPIDAFVNKLTPESAQRYIPEVNKLAYYIAQMQKAGRVVGQQEVALISKAIEIKENDTLETVATRLAQARQMVEKIIEVKLVSPNTPEPLKEVYKQNLEDIKTAIPFTVEEINKFVISRGKNKTFGEVLSERYKTQGSSGSKEGDENISSSGKPIVFKNGQWVYKQ